MNEPTIRDKDYTFAQKCEHFWMYYKWHTMGGILLLLVLSSVIVSVVTAKEKALSIMIFDTSVVDDGSIAEEFADFADIDTRKYEVVCQIGGSTEADQYSAAMYNAKLMALVNAGDLDILVTQLQEFNKEAESGFFMDMREVFTTEELASMPDLVKMPDGRIVGIRAEMLPAFASRDMFDGKQGAKEVAVGIIINTQNIDMSKRFVEYLNSSRNL